MNTRTLPRFPPLPASVAAAAAAATYETVVTSHPRDGRLIGGNRVTTVVHCALVQINSARREKGESRLGQHERWADVAVQEAEDAECAVARFGHAVMAAIEDEHISPVERRRLVLLRSDADREARETVEATERTTIAELLAESAKTVRPFNPHVLGRAEQAGMLIVPLEWRRRRNGERARLQMVSDSEPPTAA